MDSSRTREGEKSTSNADVENILAKEDTFIIGDTRPREDSSSKDLKHKKAQALAKANARHIIKSWKSRHLNMDSDYLPSKPYVQHTGGAVQTSSGERIYFKWDENGKITNPRQPKAVSKLYAYRRKRMAKKKANLSVLASKSAPNRELEYSSTNVKNDRINTSTVATNISLAERNQNKMTDEKAYTGQEEMYFPEAQRHQTQKVKRVEFDLSPDRHLGVKEAFLSGSARTKAGNSSINKRNNATKYIHSKTESHKKQPADSNTSTASSECLADSDKENANTFAPVTCSSNKSGSDINIPGSKSQRLQKEHKRRGSLNELGGGHLSLPQKQSSFANKKELVIDRTGKTEQKCSKPHPPFPKSNLHAKSSDSLGPVKKLNGQENGVEADNGYTLKPITHSTKEISLSESIPPSTNKTIKLPEGALHTSADELPETYIRHRIHTNDCSFRKVSADHQLGEIQTSAAQTIAVAMQGNVTGNGDVLEKMTSKKHSHGHASSSSSVSIGKDSNKFVTSTANVTNPLLSDGNDITVKEKESGKRVEYRGHLRTIVEGCAELVEQSANDSSQSCASVLTDSMASNEALNGNNGPALYQVKEGLLLNTFPTKSKSRSLMETEIPENRLSVSWPKTHMPKTNIEQELVTDSFGKSTPPNRLDLFGVDHVSGKDSQPLSINRYRDKNNAEGSPSHAFDSIGKKSLFPENESIIGTAGNEVDEHRVMQSANIGKVSSLHLESQPKDWPVSLNVSSPSQYPDVKEDRLCVNEIQDTDQDFWPTSGRPSSACPSRQLGLPLLWTDEAEVAQDDDIKFINDENDFYEVFGYDAETTELLRATRIFPVNNFQSEQEINNNPDFFRISAPGKKAAQSKSDISGERPRVSGLSVQQRDIKTKPNLRDTPFNAQEQRKNISVRDDVMQFKYSSNISDPEYQKLKARKRTVSFASRTQSDESLYGNIHPLSKDGPKHHSKYSTQSVLAIMSTSSSSSSPSSSYVSQMISPPIVPTRKGEYQLKGPPESNSNNVISTAKRKNYQTWRKISQGDDKDVERQLPYNKINLERAPRPPPALQSSQGGRKTPQKGMECQQTVTTIPLQQRKIHGDTDADLKKSVTLNFFPEPVITDMRSLSTVPKKNTKPASRKIRQTEVYLNPSAIHSCQTVPGPENKPDTFAGHVQKLKRLQGDDHTLTTTNVNLVPGSYNDAADRIRSRILEQNPGTIIPDNSLPYKNGRKPSQALTACSNATETKGQSNETHAIGDKEQNTHSPLSTQLSNHSSLIKPRKLKPIIHHPGMHKRHQHLASGP